MREVSNGIGDGLDALWNARRVCAYLCVTDRWIRRAMSGGWFPRPDFRLNRTHGMRWKQSTIDAYLQSKATGNGGPGG